MITSGSIYMDIFIGVIALGLLGVILYQIWYWMTYKHVTGPELFDTGTVTDMDYVPPQTRSSFNGKTTTTSTTPAKHKVFINADKLGKLDLNDEKLYQTVRLDDKVSLCYAEEFRVRKNMPEDKLFLRNNITSVTAPTGRKVAL